MTRDIILEVKKRAKAGEKPADKNSAPAVLYGRGVENIMLWIDKKKFGDVYDEIGESTVFKVSMGGEDKRNVLVKEIQRDALNGDIRHVDFYQVRMDEEIEADIELVFAGESPAVKEHGGVLIKNMDSIPVKCLPGDLPSEIEVNVGAIRTFDDYIFVKNLGVSDKVEVLVDPETVVAMAAPPRTEEELAELETEVKEDVTQVEGVVKEEKPEGEAEGEIEGKGEGESKTEAKEEKPEKPKKE